MKRALTIQLAAAGSYLKDLVELTKFRLGTLVIFSSVASLYVVSRGQADMLSYVLLGLGGFLITGAANALNEILERDFDAMMERTKDRPLPAGRMSSSEAVFYAGVMILVGTVFLVLLHPLTAFLAMISLVLYAFIYTPLKRVTNLSVLVGAVPGAMPLLIGGVAYHGSLQVEALYLFAVQFFWQFGHFWAIAWLADEDYKRAGYRLLPFDGRKTRRVGLISVLSSVPMLFFSVALMLRQPLHLPMMLLVVGSGLYFLYRSYELYRKPSDASARGLMYASFIYLPVVLVGFMWGV